MGIDRNGGIAVVLGTRPEMIKLAPVVHHLGDRAEVIHTGQHFDDRMSRAILEQVGLHRIDHHLEVGGMSRGAQIGAATGALDELFGARRYAAVLVQGDTNSTLAGALAANARDIPIAHLEAGLRSFDRRMPEEHNRVLTDALADLCLVPIEDNAVLLEREGVGRDRIRVIGSTLADAVAHLLPSEHDRRGLLAELSLERDGYVVATVHRPENADDPVRLAAIIDELASLPVPVVLPIHPRTRKHLADFGLEASAARLRLIEPLGYREFIGLASWAALLVSDSGGVQEESTLLKRPALIVRNSTERPEILGTFADLVSPGPAIGRRAAELLADVPATLARVGSYAYPYGAGAAAAAAAAVEELAARA